MAKPFGMRSRPTTTAPAPPKAGSRRRRVVKKTAPLKPDEARLPIYAVGALLFLVLAAYALA
jgi:hypothetical protein